MAPIVEARSMFELFSDMAQGEGSYAVYVGSLTVPLHNAWADAAIAWLAASEALRATTCS